MDNRMYAYKAKAYQRDRIKVKKESDSLIDTTARIEGKAIDKLFKMRVKKAGVSNKSMIWNTAARQGQLEAIQLARWLKNNNITLDKIRF